MKIHHLNCGSFCPLLGGADAVCHCLLLETDGENLERLRELRRMHGSTVSIFSSHSRAEFTASNSRAW